MPLTAATRLVAGKGTGMIVAGFVYPMAFDPWKESVDL
jgi:hypothetical protein